MRILHSGDLGDVIYACAGLRQLAIESKEKIEVILAAGGRVREQMTLEKAYSLGTLLGRQDWCAGWSYSPIVDIKVDRNFEEWRVGYKSSENLAASQCGWLEVNRSCISLPWLSVPPLRVVASGERQIVVARSHRYRNASFPWKEIGDRFKDEAICVGTHTEFEELGWRYGFSRRVDTPTIGILARIIAGADLVITNQTLCYAIAEGLKKPVWLERWLECPNVDFGRDGVLTDRDQILGAL